MNLYLVLIIEELKDLHENGLKFTPLGQDQPITMKVHTLVSPVDSIERCALQNMHQYNGENGCTFCLDKGESFPIKYGALEVAIE